MILVAVLQLVHPIDGKDACYALRVITRNKVSRTSQQMLTQHFCVPYPR